METPFRRARRRADPHGPSRWLRASADGDRALRGTSRLTRGAMPIRLAAQLGSIPPVSSELRLSDASRPPHHGPDGRFRIPWPLDAPERRSAASLLRWYWE